MKICAFIWLTLKYILVILVDVKSNSFHIYNLLTFPPEVPFRGIFLDKLKSGISTWLRQRDKQRVPSADMLRNSLFSSSGQSPLCGFELGNKFPKPFLPFSIV